MAVARRGAGGNGGPRNNGGNAAFQNVIDTQGDMNIAGPYFGTSVAELKRREEQKMTDVAEDVDETFSDLSLDNVSLPRRQLSHKYCINKFIQTMFETDDIMSIGSSDDSDVYMHVKRCKYCKNEINKRMRHRERMIEPENDKMTVGKPRSGLEKLTIEGLQEEVGYDLKEVLFIVLAGIVLIFLLDLLVKIGRKLG